MSSMHRMYALWFSRMYFCSSLNVDLLCYLSVHYRTTLECLDVIDSVTEPALRYHNLFRAEPDPLVLLAWQCKQLTSLTILGLFDTWSYRVYKTIELFNKRHCLFSRIRSSRSQSTCHCSTTSAIVYIQCLRRLCHDAAIRSFTYEPSICWRWKW
jgi:hypothetical protein